MSEPESNSRAQGEVLANKWSERSQASCQREAEIQKRLDNCSARIRNDQRLLKAAEENLERLTRSAILGSNEFSAMIPSAAREIEDRKLRIAIFERERVKIQAEIDAVRTVSPAEAKERRDNQTALAMLATERLEVDRALADTFAAALALLQERAGMTNRMLALCRKIDFTLAFDGLDSDRFDAVAASLPSDLIAKSEQWVRWLTGVEQGEAYVVADETLVLPETLASANFYRHGDRVSLTLEQLMDVRETEKTTIDHAIEQLPDGGYRAGARTEIVHRRVEKCAEVA